MASMLSPLDGTFNIWNDFILLFIVFK